MPYLFIPYLFLCENVALVMTIPGNLRYDWNAHISSIPRFLDYNHLVFKTLDKDKVNENLNLLKSENAHIYKI